MCGYKGSREGREKQDACEAAGRVQNEFFARVDEAAFSFRFSSFGALVLGELTDVSFELGSD